MVFCVPRPPNGSRASITSSMRETSAALVKLGGRSIYVLHDRKALDLDPGTAGIDVVVSGHSHRPKIETVGGVLYLNPGSAGPRRFSLPIALATLELTGNGVWPCIQDVGRRAVY